MPRQRHPKPNRATRKAARSTANPTVLAPAARAQWAVLCYLAGDLTPPLAEQIQSDLAEILATNSSPEVVVAVQFDGPDGARRYVLPAKPNPQLRPVEQLGRINSGSADVLADFLRWGLSVCPADRAALVLGGLNALDPAAAEDAEGKCGSRVFTLCRDNSCGGYMDVVDLGALIREVQAEQGRDQELLEILAVDSCHTQFLELAYQLEGRVQVLLASQTLVPDSGWNYTTVLRTWLQAVRKAKNGADAATVVRALLPAVADSYRVDDLKHPCVVSALDLRRLDDVARAFDTFCIGLIQVLGEGLIWETRRLVLNRFDTPETRIQPDAYDSGTLFILTGATLDAMADESIQGWLGTTLQRGSGPRFRRFYDAVARRLESCVAQSKDPPRLRRLIKALRSPHGAEQGAALLKEIGDGVKQRLDLLAKSPSNRAERLQARNVARDRDQRLAQAIQAELGLLPVERRFDLDRLKESAEAARRLARQARQAALTLFGSALEAEFEEPDQAGSESRAGMVIAVASTQGVLTGWPRWSGVSLYRPAKLDELMNANYQRFAFHQRVHWAAMLGAANLIEHHPRAMWRLVSSLLATGAAATRRDVLQRLTGSDSVIWGLREQFRVMAPAPTLTLSLEKRRDFPRAGKPIGTDQPDQENYLLRLESVTRGAVITEQLSRVQPKVMDRALEELGTVLSADFATPDLLRRLRSIGGLLGEDIFQNLSRTLEDERQAALEGVTNTNAHLQLQIPRELMRYPWELMHHRGEWLSERFAMGRQVFMETGLARRVLRRRQGRVRPLIIGDPLFDAKLRWRQLRGARAEAEQVAGWFKRLRDELGEVIDFERDRDTRIHTRLTLAEFRELLRNGQYDIIHFAGHGIFRNEDPETSAWLLSDGELWALEIRNTLVDHPAPPWLVYANACESAMESDRPARTYQGNVFGLATAFINQGVAAYIAPLWPIDDLLAQHIALEFYRHLLCDRATLGEALRRAKTDARRLTYPDDREDHLPDYGAWTGLGWASLVLYGDPTEELFQALAGTGKLRESETGPATQMPPPIPAKRPPTFVSTPLTQYLHAPDHVVSDWVRGPALQPLSTALRGQAPLAEGEVILELVEEAGLRRWRRRTGATVGVMGKRGPAESVETDDDGLPGSVLGTLLHDDRIRHQLAGKRGVLRVVGRWLVSGFDGGLTGLVREYDREQVTCEGLLWIPGDGPETMVPVRRDMLSHDAGAAKSDRVLLLIHGTFSRTASPVEGFGPAFLRWARERYRAVLGLDHWTLSRTPLENAEMLVEQLRVLDPQLLEGRRLDIITHSRGGLVGRAFCELLERAPAVRHLIFLGTPNCGTDLANPKNWGALADMLVNVTGLDFADLFGRLAGLLAHLAVLAGEKRIPGLLAQNPLMADVENSFLHSLQRVDAGRGEVQYAVVTAEFEPAPLIPNLKGLWQAAKAAGVDTALDRFFTDANDLVVNTAHAWCIEQGSAQRAQLPAFLKPDRVLAFVPAMSKLQLPAQVKPEVALGIHHCNLFGQPRTQERLKQWLTER
jgi:hypothetical protein